MAIIKHIKSRNANYSDALEYLLFQHNEKTGKPVLDDSRQKGPERRILYGRTEL